MEQGVARPLASTVQVSRRQTLRENLATGAFWLAGSAIVAAAQPGSDRKLAAVGAAVAGIATVLVVRRLTVDRERRHFRSLVGAMVAVSVVGDLLLRYLTGNPNNFERYGLDIRIAIPLIFVLLAPLVVGALPARLRSRALWRDRAQIWREARPLDWLAAAYALLILPDLALGLAHHAPKSYIGQDLGLIVFFVLAYVAGRTVSARAGRKSAVELVGVLLLLAGVQALLGWDTTPIFTYVEAACAGAIGFALLQPKRVWLLLLVPALALLADDAIGITNGSNSTTAIELAAALGIVGYLVVRVRHLLPQWLVVAIGVVALAGFVAFASDGATVRGQYTGPNQSNLGRAYEAHQVREAIHSSPVSFVFGRGLGGSIDESHGPKLFEESLAFGGRDLAHVQEVHLLPYEFLLKYGLLGFAWLAAFVVGAAILGIRALETATRNHDPTPVVYAALPLLGIVAALGAATHLQDNPLNAFALGVLVTRLGGKAPAWDALPRLRPAAAVPVAAVVFALVGAVAFGRSPGRFVFPFGEQGGMNAAVVGDLRIDYPLNFHRRYFTTSKHAVTGTRGIRVNGVVVASYRLKPSPELGGSGQSFPSDGVFFELYQMPRQRHRPAVRKTLPLTIFDFPDIGALRSTDAGEQGATYFSVNGRNYRAILWLGKGAPDAAHVMIDDIVASIQARKP